MNNHSLPKIKIINTKKEKDYIRTTLEIVNKKDYFHEPIAPAWIGADGYTFELHKLVSFEKNILVFKTYTYDSKLPTVGQKYDFCTTFTKDQVELIKNTSINWVKKKFDNEMCNCDFSLWGDLKEEGAYGYTDGEDWITIEDYEKYIKNDILRIRET